MSSRIVEACLVIGLFLGYVTLWQLKRRQEIRRTGVDPEVLLKATTPVQSYFARFVKVFMLGVVVLIGVHAIGPEHWAAVARVEALNRQSVDFGGAAISLLGLAVCLAAQVTMGRAWRVGIDAERRTELVTRGLFRYVRNPTYLGLHIFNIGLWLIWPTTAMASYALLFFVVMELQVRCEEEHLARLHGETFHDYAARTKRYLPWIY